MSELVYNNEYEVYFDEETISIVDKTKTSDIDGYVEIPYNIFEEIYDAWHNDEYNYTHMNYSYEYLEGPAILHIETPLNSIYIPANIWRRMLSDYVRYSG